MTNIIIGLCVGAVSAVLLFVLWRAAEKLRHELEQHDQAKTDRKPADRNGY